MRERENSVIASSRKMAGSNGPFPMQAKELSQDWWKANEYCNHTPFFGWLRFHLSRPEYMNIWVDNQIHPNCVFLVRQETDGPDYVIIKEMRDVENKTDTVIPFLLNKNIIRMNRDIDFDYIESDLWDLTIKPALEQCFPTLLSRFRVVDLGACLSPEKKHLNIPGEDYEITNRYNLPKEDLKTDVDHMMHLNVVDEEAKYAVGVTVFGLVKPLSGTLDWQKVEMRAALAILASDLLGEERDVFIISTENNLQPFRDLLLRESRRFKRIEYRHPQE